jgi:hypothetical protein
MPDDDVPLTVDQAYEVAFRYVMQYLAREPGSVSLQDMAIAMEPTGTDDPSRSNDPASWEDFLECVRETRAHRRLPSPFLD